MPGTELRALCGLLLDREGGTPALQTRKQGQRGKAFSFLRPVSHGNRRQCSPSVTVSERPGCNGHCVQEIPPGPMPTLTEMGL